jgi:hypothetical protein
VRQREGKGGGAGREDGEQTEETNFPMAYAPFFFGFATPDPGHRGAFGACR